MNAAICAAIRNRSVLRFMYGGGVRTVEPHCHGISQAGNEVLRAWQTGGYSESGDPVGWKLFEVSRITGFSQTGTAFSSNRPGYNPGDRQMKSVHCNV
jgi:hypothetical protein